MEKGGRVHRLCKEVTDDSVRIIRNGRNGACKSRQGQECEKEEIEIT